MNMKRLYIFLLAVVGVIAVRADYEESMLTGLKGVGLEIRPINLQSDTFDLSVSAIENHIIDRLEHWGIRFLSDMELEVMPGQPFLEVSLDVIHAQGPSHLYVIQLELREMAELKRPQDSVVTIAVGTWERQSMGVANRVEAIYNEVDKLLRLFADELVAVNR